MAKIAIVKNEDYSIATWYEADEPNQGVYGGPWGNSNSHTHIQCPVELDYQTVIAQDDGDDGIELVVNEDLANAKLASQWSVLRAERNFKLTACDYTQLVDSPLDAPTKAEWATYRQDLRDLPENTVDPTNPTWPTEPTN
jgi:hypothetical protein